MSDMKCPFCQQELQETFGIIKQFWCSNYYNHTHPINLQGTKELWQELIRTRKALDVAKDTIRHADWFFDGDYVVYTKDMHNEIKYAIKAIQKLEQKDVK